MLINEINYSGWGLAEFKYCPKRDDFVLMEINAKFWVSCDFTFRNNPEFLKLLFGIDAKSENIKKMVFLDRVMMRDRLFFIKNVFNIIFSKIKYELLSCIRQFNR